VIYKKIYTQLHFHLFKKKKQKTKIKNKTFKKLKIRKYIYVQGTFKY